MAVDPGVHEDLGDRHAGGADAGDDDPDVVHLLADDPQRVLEGGEGDDGGAVLVVVEDGDVEQRPQPLLDLEARRRGDVLEVDAAEAGGDALDRLDDGVDPRLGEVSRARRGRSGRRRRRRTP